MEGFEILRQANIRQTRVPNLRYACLRKAPGGQRLTPAGHFQRADRRGERQLCELLAVLSLFMLSAPFTYQLGEVIYGPPDFYDAKYIFYIRFVLVLACASILAFSYFFLRIPFRLNPFPALLLVPFGISMTWSWDPYMTFRGLLEFGACIGFGYVLALHLSRLQVAAVILHTLGLSLILSAIWAFVFPDVAIHSEVGDLSQDGHGGLWRGIYVHKNILGGIAGLALPLYLGPGRVFVSPRLLWFTYLASAALCLAKAGGGTGLAIAVTGSIFTFVLALRGLFRLIGAVILAVTAVSFALLGDALFPAVLELMGKDLTLSGRTYIWEAALDLIAGSPILGSGYPSLTNPEVIDRFQSTAAVETAHNAYLQILIESGIVGLSLWALAVVRALLRITPELEQRRMAPEVIVLLTIIICLLVQGISEPSFIDFKQSLMGPVWVIVLIVLGSAEARLERVEFMPQGRRRRAGGGFSEPMFEL